MGGIPSKNKDGSENLPTNITGLYPTCAWDPKSVRRLVLSRKVAPLFPGRELTDEEKEREGLEECPICFLNYPMGLNRFTCCKQRICTECFLQISKPTSFLNVTCPFCNRSGSTVFYKGPLTAEEKAQEAHERQKVIELKIKIRNEEIERDKQREIERKSRSMSEPVLPTDVDIRQSQTVPITKKEQTEKDNYAMSFPLGHNDDITRDLEIEELFLKQAIQNSLQESPPPTRSPIQFSQESSNEEEEQDQLPDFEEKQEDKEEDDEFSEDLQLALALSMSLHND